MDVEFGERVLRNGGRIGYEPSSIVYHEVDWNRLTEDSFVCVMRGKEEAASFYKSSSLPTIMGDLIRATCILGLYSLLNDERKKYRAKGRYFHYRAMLGEKFAAQPFACGRCRSNYHLSQVAGRPRCDCRLRIVITCRTESLPT